MTAPDESSVRITQREVYDKVLAVDDAVSKMSSLLEVHIELTKQNQLSVEARLGSTDNRLEAHGARLSQHDAEILTQGGRIGAVETRLDEARKRKATWPQIVGAVGAIVAGATTLGGIIWALAQVAGALGAIAN
jgi:hypothetical protein